MAHQLNLGLPVPISERASKVYGILFAAAEAGLPCPSNAEMSRTLCFCDNLVSKAVDELDRLGMIRRTNMTIGRRTVVITATGKECKKLYKGGTQPMDVTGGVAAAELRHATALAGMRFEDHPKAKTGKGYPQFYPARHQAYGHEAMC